MTPAAQGMIPSASDTTSSINVSIHWHQAAMGRSLTQEKGNPRSCEWGGISWGHATSSDLVTWELEGTEPVLVPDTTYDCEGVFTGCLVPTGLRGEEGQLSVIYTSVCHLPIHWTIPYKRASEGIAAATSSDGGKTWTKAEGNPLLDEEPKSLHVTGWRDPYVTEWPALDHIRGESSLYGLVSGGVHGLGPSVFLYSVPPRDLTNWEYLGQLLQLPKNYRLSQKWSGDFGVNLECANIVTLRSSPTDPSFEFLVAGSEGGAQRGWVTDYLADRPTAHPRRTIRYCNWLSGRLEKANDGGITLKPSFGGLFDHGALYAINSFRDPVSGRQLAWGWIPEEDIAIDYCKEKGWNGCLSLCREIFLQRISNVAGSSSSRLDEITSVHLEPETARDTFTVYTLGIRPLPEISQLQFAEPQTWKNITIPGSSGTETVNTRELVRGQTWKLRATIDIVGACAEVGFHIRHNSDLSVRTTVLFSPPREEIVVDRSRTTADTTVNTCQERGPFTLFTHGPKERQTREKLELDVFWDGNVLELFACERFALSTMVYTMDTEAVGISLFAKGQRGSAVFEQVEISHAREVGI